MMTGNDRACESRIIAAAPQNIERNFETSTILSEDERWYAVHTLPVSELKAASNLNSQEFRTFLPKRQKTVRHARKLLTVEAAFFPRYLFVALDLNRDPWRRVNGTFGVSRLVMRGDGPQPVPPGIVEALLASCDERGLFRHRLQLRIGDSVRMMDGPFAERLAVLDRLDDDGRVHILLDLMGRKVPTSTHADRVLPLAKV